MLCLCRVTQNRSADTESAGSAYASGFIVDAKRGLILTNRHVVTPGMFLHAHRSFCLCEPCNPGNLACAGAVPLLHPSSNVGEQVSSDC